MDTTHRPRGNSPHHGHSLNKVASTRSFSASPPAGDPRGSSCTPISQVRKLRLREGKQPTRGHSAWQRQDLNPEDLTAENASPPVSQGKGVSLCLLGAHLLPPSTLAQRLCVEEGAGEGTGGIHGEGTALCRSVLRTNRKCRATPSSCFHVLCQQCLLFLAPPGELLCILPNSTFFEAIPGLPKMR